LDLPNEFGTVHPVFDVSMLKKYFGDLIRVQLGMKPIEIKCGMKQHKSKIDEK